MTTVLQPSWTGSENERKPQGTCRPPVKPMDETPRFLIPVATEVQVVDVTGGEWRTYVTTKDNEFERYDSRGSNTYTFRRGGWLMRVDRRDITYRRFKQID